MRKNVCLYAIIAILSVLQACSGEKGENKEKTSIVPEDSIVTLEDNREDKYIFPSPLQVAFIFKKAGLVYQPGLVHDLNKAGNYETKYKQKLNFGVYAADLAYLVLNKKNQEAILTLKTLGTLSERMWMTNLFSNMDVLRRFENNIGNEDSVVAVIADIQLIVDNYLETNGLTNNAAVIFAGAWIESMYLASQVYQKKSNEELLNRLSEQKVILEQIIYALEKNQEHDYSELIIDLKGILAAFPLEDTIEQENDTLNGNQSESFAYKISEKELKIIADKIRALRSKIVAI